MNKVVKYRMILAVVTGLCLCLTGLFWPRPEARRPLTVAVNIWPGAEGLISARQSEQLRGVPASFLEFSWSSPVLGAFQKRVVDAAVVSLDELLRLEAGEAMPEAVLVLGVSQGADALLARPGITSVHGLRGRRIGVEMYTASESLLVSCLHKHGLKLTDVEIVPMNLAETEAAYLEKDLDAVVTSDPWRARLVDRGAVVLCDSEDMGLELARVLVVRRDAPTHVRASLQRLMQASLAHARQEGPCWQPEGLAAVLRREGLTLRQWEAALSRVRLVGLEENQRLLKGELEPVLQQVEVRMQSERLLPRSINASLLLNPELLEEQP